MCCTERRRFTRTRFFSRASPVSVERLLEEQILEGGGRIVADSLQQISEDLGIVVPALPVIAVNIYIPHVYLMFFAQSWNSYCLPLFSARRRGLGLDLIPEALALFEQRASVENDYRRDPLDVVCLQELADAIRGWSHAPQLVGEASREQRVRFVQVLQSRIDELREPRSVFHARQWAYPMEHLVNTFVMSTLLRDTGSLLESCRRAVRLCFTPEWADLWLHRMSQVSVGGMLLVVIHSLLRNQ
jgi:hypothetical protein